MRTSNPTFGTWLRRLLPASFLGILFAAGLVSATAAGPVFNGTNEEYPTLSVAHAGGNTFETSASAQVGDVLEFDVWVHNSVDDASVVAQAVRAALAIPTNVGSTHQVTARLTADNAATVTGQVTVTTPADAYLTPLTDTIKLRSYQAETNSYVEVPWPSSTNPQDLLTSQGVLLGTMKGCWQYAHEVRIQVRVDQYVPKNPVVSTYKQVGLTGSKSFSDTGVTANPGDAVEFVVQMENKGTGPGSNPTITDILDSHLTYESNAVVRSEVWHLNQTQDEHLKIDDPTIEVLNDGTGRTKLTWNTSQLHLPTTMNNTPNDSFYLLFYARVSATTTFPIGTTVIRNTATSCLNGTVCANTNPVTVTVTRQETPTYTFSIVKEAANVTNGEKDYKKILPTAANVGDTIRFHLNASLEGNNTGADTVTIKDLLPAGLTYKAGSTTMYDSTNGTTGTPVSDSWITTGYTVNHMNPTTAGAKVLVFDATLTGSCQSNYTNNAEVWWNGTRQANDSLTIIGACTKSISITKTVRGPGQSDFSDDAGVVKAGDILTYKIDLNNNSDAYLSQPFVYDQLPAYVTYVTGSLRQDNTPVTAQEADNFFHPNLSSLTPGIVMADNLGQPKAKEFLFQVQVVACPQFGDTRVANVASFGGHDKAGNAFPTVTDTAYATIRVTRPSL